MAWTSVQSPGEGGDWICPSCGARHPRRERFCSQCGHAQPTVLREPPGPPDPPESSAPRTLVVRLAPEGQQQTIRVPGDFYPEEVMDALKEMGFLEMGRDYEFLDWPREKGRWSAPVCRLPGTVLHLAEREPEPWKTDVLLYGAPAARGMSTRQLERQTEVLTYE